MKIIRIIAACLVLLVVVDVRAAYLGVGMEPTDNAGRPAIIVRSVAPRSPAAAAGLQPGDIISRIQRESVSSPEDVVERVRSARAGNRMEIEIIRGGKPLSVSVTLAEAPAADPRTEPAPAGAAAPAGGGVDVVAKQSPHCSVLAPQDWNFQSSANASSAEALSGNRRMYAGWGVTPVNTDQAAYFGPLYGPPEQSILFLTEQITQKLLGDPSGVQYASATQPFLNYFTLRQVQSARTQGYVFYHIYPGMAGPRTYTESVYLALADKALGPAGVAIASGVAVSLRCQTQLVPVRNDPPRASKNGAKKRTACGQAEGNLKGYNKELGVQSVHTANGTDILMDATTPYENGPDGPGWYVHRGAFKEKLQLGRSDDC